jgi:hypothetical protein
MKQISVSALSYLTNNNETGWNTLPFPLFLASPTTKQDEADVPFCSFLRHQEQRNRMKQISVSALSCVTKNNETGWSRLPFPLVPSSPPTTKKDEADFRFLSFLRHRQQRNRMKQTSISALSCVTKNNERGKQTSVTAPSFVTANNETGWSRLPFPLFPSSPPTTKQDEVDFRFRSFLRHHQQRNKMKQR